MVEVAGNRLLAQGDYLKFTGLNNRIKYKDISLSVIKKRFEKHPYIQKADVELLSGNTARVVVTERNIEAVLLFKGEPNFLTRNSEVLPVLPNTKFLDLPVISNAKINGPLKLFSKLENGDIEQAFKIIEAAKLANKSIANRLSEINLRNGGEIVLSFSGITPPVLFGKGETAKKMVYLDAIWNGIMGENSVAEKSSYVDLRFTNEIFLGAVDKTGLN